MGRRRPRIPLHPGASLHLHGRRHHQRHIHVRDRGDHEQAKDNRPMGRGNARTRPEGGVGVERDGRESHADGPREQRAGDSFGGYRDAANARHGG